MTPSLDFYLPYELAVAPNPYGLAHNLKLTTVAASGFCFELWQPLLGQLLLPEEAMLLKGDCPRVEEICALLVEALGASLMAPNSIAVTGLSHWRQVRASLGSAFDAIALQAHLRQAPMDQSDIWRVQTALDMPGQQLVFLRILPWGTGYQLEALPQRLQLHAEGSTMVS